MGVGWSQNRETQTGNIFIILQMDLLPHYPHLDGNIKFNPFEEDTRKITLQMLV